MGDLACGLVSRGIPVTVLTATAANPKFNNDLPVGLEVIRLSNNLDDSKKVFNKIKKGILFLVGAFAWGVFYGRTGQQIFIASNPPFIGLLGPLLKLKGMSYIFIFQDLFPRSAVLSGVLPAVGPITSFWRLIMAFICKNSKYTVVLNKAMLKRLTRDFGDKINAVSIHNWAVEQALPISRAENKFSAELGISRFFIVQYSGNFGRMHDLLTLLEAARLLEDAPIRFLFIGDGSKINQIISYLDVLRLSNIVKMPYQCRSRLPESLGACDISVIGLIPGAEDTVAPCKFYGILASGRPVLLIARRNCDLAQLVISENIGVVVEPGEAYELSQVLRALQLDPDRVLLMGCRARYLYESRFGKERSIDQYALLLD
ncbi:glycosyltransferase family 4 protein [Synechococcus lacustris]|jgi:glycosyltransferase involved in cell wall biosynthesis|uniref:glycosyltransferase family 4 protein n=1 Tax=Synechococcus lacustris TaxID=2116544 RepID=UPI0020CED25D|nr:glycosyltransferase family 4 protein [Synechococcus lacustris]